ncbi:MAG: GNAT family N-acetyltransferase [Bacteroidetes bacterium]|nr:GNAT family N-acetyltransferase [Bacteroidota bacterium]
METKFRNYKPLSFNSLEKGNYKLIPIRDEDKFIIMQWRNAQIDILRQNNLLTKEQQELYFKNVVEKLFDQENPSQLLFSFFENDNMIGYGGLVHIDWEKKAAEISFLTETSRNHNKEIFISDWVNYLSLIKQIADVYLNFDSIFTYAYDIRPHLYIALEKSGFEETKRIKNHITINNELKDVVIHTAYFDRLTITEAILSDVDLYYNWANDPNVRKFSFQQNPISYDNHVDWFKSKINDPSFKFYLFENKKKQKIGQVRINKNSDETIVGISIASEYRGLGYGAKMLVLACTTYFALHPTNQITAYIKADNIASINIFKKAGFSHEEPLNINGINSIKIILKNERF